MAAPLNREENFQSLLKQPETAAFQEPLMSKSVYPLKLPDLVKRAAQQLAKEDGVSLNQ
jgi:hypothetical protein